MFASMFAVRIIPLWAQMHHPVEPPGFVSYLIVAVAAVVVAWVFYLAIRMTVAPGETDRNHIKRTILDEEPGHRDE